MAVPPSRDVGRNGRLAGNFLSAVNNRSTIVMWFGAPGRSSGGSSLLQQPGGFAVGQPRDLAQAGEPVLSPYQPRGQRSGIVQRWQFRAQPKLKLDVDDLDRTFGEFVGQGAFCWPACDAAVGGFAALVALAFEGFVVAVGADAAGANEHGK